MEIDQHEIKIVALYFGANWCPISRIFTTILAEFYNEIYLENIEKKQLEIIYVPLDKSQEDFDSHYTEMPWMAYNFGDEKIKALKEKYDVRSIPMIVVLDTDTQKAISIRGRKEVQDHGLQAFEMWKDIQKRQEWSFDTLDYPITKVVTEEARIGEEIYTAYQKAEKEKKQALAKANQNKAYEGKKGK